MKYPFPQITRIDDILKAIEGRPEFIVAEREHFDVVNYMVSMPTSFEMEGPDDYYGALRRECRGIIFDKQGNLISRPYHKFFNLNEREETQIHVVDFGAEHIVLEKADGSMIRPLVINGELKWASKMGITFVSELVDLFVAKNQQIKYEEFARYCIDNSWTPLFEFCSKENKVVLSYAEDQMILTAVRDNFSGAYLSIFL